MENKIPPQFFFRHLQKVKEIWLDKATYEMDSIVLVNGKGNGGNEKTIAIVSWFFAGYNLADTIIGISQRGIIIYASDRKVTFLSNLKDDPLAKKHNLAFYAKNQSFNDTFDKIWADLHDGLTNPKVGMIVGDAKTGQIAEEFMRYLEEQPHSKVQVLNFFNQCFMIKDAQEIQNLKKSSKVTSYFFTKFIKEVEVVIDSGKQIKHSELTKTIVEHMENEGELKKCAIKLSSNKVVKDYIDLGAPCSIQSGGSYSNKIFIESNDKELKSDCILLGLGSMYRSYNTFIGRTLLIDPNEEQKSIYKKVETLVKVLIQNLRPGVKICDVYKKARQFMQDTLPSIEPPKSFGYGMGIFLSQNSLTINETNDRVISPGFSFLVSCNLNQIKYESKKQGSKIFAIHLSDNVIVTEKGQEVLTGQISKVLTEISYSLEDEQDEKKQNKARPSSSSNIIQGRRRKVQQATNQKLKNQKERNEHQALIKKKKLEELKERSNQNFNDGFKKQKTIECHKIQCYKHKQDLPKDLKPKLIYIDNKTNSILLPINGQHVPFHICILKSVVKNDEGKHASLRFNFHLPNSIPTLNFPKYTEPAVFVKEIVFRSQNIARVAELERQVKALQKKVRMELSEKHAKEDIVEQQKISFNKGKRPILRDLYARPGIGQKKTKGNLQCHLNGFRYTTNKGQIIDVPFSNIKFAFFQPCEKQIIAAIHFRLNEPILVGKKKTEDIQFYSQGGIVAEDVVGRGRQDSDDEQRQKEVKKRIDRDFMAWAKACQEFTNKSFDFETPNRSLGFYGTTNRSNVLLQPTKSCLINITQPHFFVFCIDDIEVAWFQRMTGNVRYFDLTLVHKDYEFHVRINSISIKDVQKVKDWLDSNNIIFYDNKISVNWNKFLQGVRSDFKKFVQDGAWTAWDQADDEEDDGVEDGDSQFSASQEDFDQQSQDSEDSQSDYEKQDGDSDQSESEEDLSEEGLSWDEMEEKAEREDREKLKKEIEKEKQREKSKIKKR